jgi:hypothetical protein
MPGASEETRRVKILSANWVPDGAEGDGRFEVMILTLPRMTAGDAQATQVAPHSVGA